MGAEDEDEQIKQSLPKLSSGILAHHNPDPGPANLAVGRAGAPRVSLMLLQQQGEVGKRSFSVQFVSVTQKGSGHKGFDTSLAFIP